MILPIITTMPHFSCAHLRFHCINGQSWSFSSRICPRYWNYLTFSIRLSTGTKNTTSLAIFKFLLPSSLHFCIFSFLLHSHCPFATVFSPAVVVVTLIKKAMIVLCDMFHEDLNCIYLVLSYYWCVYEFSSTHIHGWQQFLFSHSSQCHELIFIIVIL